MLFFASFNGSLVDGFRVFIGDRVPNYLSLIGLCRRRDDVRLYDGYTMVLK